MVLQTSCTKHLVLARDEFVPRAIQDWGGEERAGGQGCITVDQHCWHEACASVVLPSDFSDTELA